MTAVQYQKDRLLPDVGRDVLVELSQGSVAEMPDTALPPGLQEDSARLRNAYYYSRNIGLPADQAYELEPQISEALYGSGTTSESAWSLNQRRILSGQRKGPWAALRHGVARIEHLGAVAIAGLGRQFAEIKGLECSLIDPAFRWMFDLPEDIDLDKFLVDISEAVSKDFKESSQQHPEWGYAIDPDIGYAETLWQVVSRPENLVQGLVEAVPLVAAGALGTMTGGPVAGISAMAIPITGEVYQQAREEGSDVLSAFAQAQLTGWIEAAIEQWTLGRKMALGKNFRAMLRESGTRRVLWEGVKAFFRGTAEEGSQEFNRNFWQWIFTNRDQKWFENVKQAMAMGGPLEAAMSGVFAGAGYTSTPVDVREARRQLDIIRNSVRAAEDLTSDQKVEILAELDKALGLAEIVEAKKEEAPPAVAEKAPGVPVEARIEEVRPEAPPAEAKAKVAKPTPVEAEIEETPEEAKVAEARLEVEAAEEIEPELYIGSVTPGMKKRIAEGQGVKAEDIKGFTKEGFPTKRTKIKMTRGEAEQYLEWLEKDLQDRVDNNKIRTGNQMAWANADWGDIKNLRRILGLPEGQRPFRIIYSQKEGIVYKESGELKQAYKELTRLRQELKKAKTSEAIQEIEDQIEAQERLIDGMQRAMDKAVTVVKTREAIRGAIEPSTLQESKMTVQEVLRAVMKRGARFAKMAYAAGRRELRAQLRVKARAKARLNKALKTINQNVPKTVDFFYREAIEALRSNFDLKHRSERSQAKRKATLDFLRRVPEEERANMPISVIDRVTKVPLDDMTIEQVEQVAEEVQRLIDQGKLKRRLKLKPILEQRKTDKSLLSQAIEQAKKAAKYTKTLLWTWTPSRIFDLLDGGKGTFSGAWHRIFYDETKRHKATVETTIREAEKAFVDERKRLGISFWDLARTRRVVVDGKEMVLTTQRIIGIYMNSLNPQNRLHLIYGRYDNRGNSDPTDGVGFTDKGIADVIEAMTPQEKALADYMLGWYDENQPALRQAVIEQENRDMGKEEFYSPIQPTDTTWRGLQQEVRMAIDQRLQLRAHNVAHGFTLDRKDVPESMRSAINLDAVNIFVGQIQKQMRYIHLGPHIRRMNKLRGATAIRKAISDKFGTEMLRMIDGYVASVANPYIYRQYNLPERISARLRQNTAIAYLAFNLTTMAKQPFALLFYLPDAGPAHLIASMLDFAQHPLEMIKKVRNLDPEIAQESMEREFRELRGGPNATVIRKAITDAGLEGIYFFDQIARTIGWNAVYERNIAEGKSPEEAARAARNATLRTQNAAEAEDIPALYRTNEILNWFTLFTNQINKMWNMATYDIPSYFQNENYAAGVLGITALAINGLVMWMIANRKWPEEPEELVEAIAEQSLEMIPILGKGILDASKGFETEVPIFTPMKAAGKVKAYAVRGMKEGKWQLSRGDGRDIAEGISIAMGIPYTSIKRGVQAVEEKQPTALLGARRRQTKKTRRVRLAP